MVEQTIGEQELALLRYLSDNPGATVGEVTERFGRDRELARSTILTMMERLRKKGYLSRRLVDGLYRYDPQSSTADLLRSLVRRFVEKSLGGSVTPFVAYLNESGKLSDEELEDLENLVSRLQSERRKGTE